MCFRVKVQVSKKGTGAGGYVYVCCFCLHAL